MRIEDWRAQIDEIDNELLRLLNRRARLAARIGGMKLRAGLPLYDPDREREVHRAGAVGADDLRRAHVPRRLAAGILAWLGGHGAFPSASASGRWAARTSLVTVCRSTAKKAWQPEPWNHVSVVH